MGRRKDPPCSCAGCTVVEASAAGADRDLYLSSMCGSCYVDPRDALITNWGRLQYVKGDLPGDHIM